VRVVRGRLSGANDLLPSATRLEDARRMTDRFADLREARLVRLPPVTDALRRSSGRVWLALESMQVTGSFKVRGALLAVERLRAERAGELSIVAASAGNHGAGVAYAAKHFGVHAEVVVPRGAPRAKTQKIEAYGATVVVSSCEGYDGAEAEAIARARAHGWPFLSPYDDPDVVVGNGGSLGLEIVRALGKVPDRVLCPIGGGGLAAGLAAAMHDERGGGDAMASPVLPVQSEASCAFAQSLERGAAVIELPPADTLAEGLEGGISARAFARTSALIDTAVVCTESEIAQAMRLLVRELGLIVEGSAAVALAPVIDSCELLPENGDTVVVLTGRNIDFDRLTRMLC
jgi:threonine dehydratase